MLALLAGAGARGDGGGLDDAQRLFAAIDLLDQRHGQAPVMSINDAASRAQDRFGGQVISITPADQDGRRGYRVKVLLETGRVKTLFVESRTGDVIDRRGRNP
ncbi:MAG: hypothetical protein MK142_13270 [Pseudomonadales bacterium]|nr:hypothetical protein [Pseudomonadales bacterium]